MTLHIGAIAPDAGQPGAPRQVAAGSRMHRRQLGSLYNAARADSRVVCWLPRFRGTLTIAYETCNSHGKGERQGNPSKPRFLPMIGASLVSPIHELCGYCACGIRLDGAEIADRGHRPQHSASAATVNIHVRNLAQLFNSLDPSPFWDRDLDRDAAEFIEEEFSEKPSAKTWHLHVHTQEGVAEAVNLQAAVEHYYERMANSARYSLRDEMRHGQLALLGGLGIFLVSMTIRGILTGLVRGGAPRILDEGLIIVAWLALWRPAEWLVDGWVPLHRKRRLYERLAAIRVSLRTDAAHIEASSRTLAMS